MAKKNQIITIKTDLSSVKKVNELTERFEYPDRSAFLRDLIKFSYYLTKKEWWVLKVYATSMGEKIEKEDK